MHNALRIDRIYTEKRVFFNIFALKSYIAEQIALQKENIFLWVPVFFACGIALYFFLPFEPPQILAIFCFIIPIILYSLASEHRPSRLFLIALIICASGFLSAKIRTDMVSTTVLKEKIYSADLTGTVLSIEKTDTGGGSRVLLGNVRLASLQENQTPEKVRIRFRKDDNLKVGQIINVKAGLNPPADPVIPGGFDFRRYLFFQNIGSVGFAYSEAKIIQDAAPSFFNIESIRFGISNILHASLPERTAGIASALIVGQKQAIEENDQQTLRDAGLAHMLAISGLHVGIFSGTLFFILRLCLACVPNMALRYPIKKIAAVFALIGAMFYMMLAGTTVPTQRAVLMISIVFLAIIIDRSPISLRLVAFAALVVLLVKPESLLSVSFQMSFAAVTCLIYFYDVTRTFWTNLYTNARITKKAMMYFLAICLTTIIASIATAPFALYHFGQVSFMGSVANLVAVPLLSFVIMPFALLSLILMPIGLSYIPIQIMGWGIDAMLDIAHWAANLPNAVILTPLWPFYAFAMLVLSCLFMIIWRGAGKLLAIPILGIAIMGTNTDVMPDILASDSHKLFLFRTTPDDIYVSTFRTDKFARESWQSLYGLPEKSAHLLPYKGDVNKTKMPQCGEHGCRLQIKNKNVSFIRSPYIHEQECQWADIIISVDPIKDQSCEAAYIIDKFNTWKHGTTTLKIEPDGQVRIKNIAQIHKNRPWSHYHDALK